MIQLTFQPAFDPFHAIFRLLRLRPIIATFGPLHRDHVRLLDFYLLFPFRIDGIRLIPQHRKYRRLASEYEAAKPYGDQPEDHVVFNRMGPIQTAALETLAARDLFDSERLVVGEVSATPVPVADGLASRIESANERDTELMEFLGVLASEYNLTGPNGLKARTAILEFRYDTI